MKDNKFFSFFEPVLKYIDTGKFFREPFRWLYAILAILNLLTPIVLLVMAINNDLFRYGGGRMIAAFILVWLVIAFVSWLGFQIWWNRREKVYAAATAHDDFVAIPVFSHFIQTFGEWAGMFVGIGGALAHPDRRNIPEWRRLHASHDGYGSILRQRFAHLHRPQSDLRLHNRRGDSRSSRNVPCIGSYRQQHKKKLITLCCEGGTFHRPHHFRRSHIRSSQLHLQFRTAPKEPGTRPLPVKYRKAYNYKRERRICSRFSFLF